MNEARRNRFLTRLSEFEAGYVVGHLAGVGVWFQLLTALYLENDETGEGRLVLGEAFFTADTEELNPRNACIIPWDSIKDLSDEGNELHIHLENGLIRIIAADLEPSELSTWWQKK